MFRALYNFSATQAGCLSFRAGDQFTVMGDSTGDWLRVQNGFGQIGLVPYNYVARDKEADGTEVLKSIDRAIEAIHYAASMNGDIYTMQQRDNLQRLIQHRHHVVEEQRATREGRPLSVQSAGNIPPQPKRVAPGFMSPTNEAKPVAGGNDDNKQVVVKRNAPPPPPRVSSLIISQEDQDGNRISAEKLKTPTEGKPPPAKENPPPAEGNSPRSPAVAASNVGSTVQNKPEVEVDFPPPPPESMCISPNPSIMNTPQSAYRTPMTYKTPESSLTASVSSEGMPRRDSLNIKSPAWGSPTKSLNDVTVPAFLASELIEKVRRNTGLSYDKTQVAIETVVLLIGERVPSVQPIMEKVAHLLHKSEEEEVDLEGSHDATRLGVIFSELSACKDDSQQRSWALHEDESIILEYLQELLSILENAKPSISRKMISSDNYEPLHNLVQYYQMETRVSIRLAMLKVFGALCGLDLVAISCLLYSVLPLELCRELQSNLNDISRSCYASLVLTMLLSMGEDLPINHYVHLNLSFVRFLLDTIEAPPEEDSSEQLPDLFTNLILAFNLHLRVREENIVMVVMAERGTSRIFTEKLMLLVNRGDDPVRMFSHEPKPADAVLKFLTDLYSDPATSDLLYSNDAAVLVDIIIRQLSDLPAGDKVRTSYLTLSYLLLRNSPYKERKYRSGDLKQSLLNIFREEAETITDKLVVQQIFQELPDIFNSS